MLESIESLLVAYNAVLIGIARQQKMRLRWSALCCDFSKTVSLSIGLKADNGLKLIVTYSLMAWEAARIAVSANDFLNILFF